MIFTAQSLAERFRWRDCLWLVVTVLCGCQNQRPVEPSPTRVDTVHRRDAGVTLDAAALEAWLWWQDQVSQLPEDAGVLVRARAEATLLADAGLTDAQVEAIETVIATVAAERELARLTAADALSEFRQGLAALPAEQRAKAEAALGGARVHLDAGLELTEQVRLVLSREAEVLRAWDAAVTRARHDAPFAREPRSAPKER